MDLYNTPATEFVAGFIGSPAMNIFPASDALGAGIEVSPETAKLGIRPEHIQLTNQGQPGTIRVKEKLGSESYLYVMTPDDTQIVIKTDGEDSFNAGDTVQMTFRENRLHRFDTNGLTLT